MKTARLIAALFLILAPMLMAGCASSGSSGSTGTSDSGSSNRSAY